MDQSALPDLKSKQSIRTDSFSQSFETAKMAVRIEKLDEGCTLHLQPDRPGDSTSFTIDSYLSGYSHNFRISGDPTPVLTAFSESQQLRISGDEVEEIEIKRPWGNDLRDQIDPRSIPGFPNWCVRWELGFDYSFSVFDLDDSARVWEATHWNERERLHRHFPIGFTPDGRGLWSCGQDGRPILWDVRTGRPIVRMTLDVERMTVFVESSEGQLFANESYASVIRSISDSLESIV